MKRKSQRSVNLNHWVNNESALKWRTEITALYSHLSLRSQGIKKKLNLRLRIL